MAAIATPLLDGPIRVDAPGRRQAGLSASIRHPARLTALRRLALLDTPAEQAFDRLTRLAAKILHAPVALLSLVDGDRSFFKSSVGLPELWASRREMPLSHSVCQHVVASNAPLVINDARTHPLVIDNQAVAELRIVAYMGIPLVTSEGHALGTFAVIDVVPREWASDDVTTLGDLAASAMTEIELRAQTNQHLLVEQRLHLMESVVGNAAVAVLIAEADPAEPSDPRIVFVNDAYTRLTGYSLDEVAGRTHPVLNSSETDRSQIDSIRKALATRKPARLEFLAHRKDGSAFWAEWNIVPIADKAGRYSHWVVIQRDISEQKAAEKALRESEALKRAIVDTALDCIISIDQGGKLIEFNPAAVQTFGYPRDVVLGQPMAELLIPPPLRGSHFRGLARYLAMSDIPVMGKRIECTALRADGAEFPVEVAVIATHLEGAPVFTAFLRDITARKRADEALRRSEERFRWYFELGLTGIAIATPTQGRLEVNDEFCRILGYTRAELFEKTGAEITHPDDVAADVVHFDRMLAGECDGYVLDKRWVRKDGRVIYSTVSVKCLRNADGMIDSSVAMLQDITEKKRAEEMLKEANQELEVRVAQRTAELSEANEFLKALLDNVQTGIVACNAEGVLTLFNRTTREFSGALSDSEFQLPGQPIHPDQWANRHGLYHADGQTLMTADEIPLIRALRGEHIQNVEMVIASKGGAAHTVLASGRAFYNGQGNKLGAVVSMDDVTERKRAEVELLNAHGALLKAHDELERRVEARTAELALAKEAAEAANRAKSEFFSRMSHELRTPLNVILGFGQLLEMDALSATQRESTEQIVKGGRHLLALINEVLDIARIEAGGAGQISLEEVDVGQVVGEVLRMIQPLANQAHLRLLPPQPGTFDRTVRADLQRLKQVLLNLLSNAIKYNREGGTVVVSCAEAAGAMLRISVTDTGPGIPPEKMHRLFAPFDRLEAEQKGVEGTGLGLTLSKRLVEAMQGKMGVESTVGEGSTFWVELPQIDKTGEPAGENPATVADPEETPVTAGTVLYVEDNPANFRLVERILTFRPGVRLLSAMQGRLGIDLAREHHPDVIFLDLHLPDLQGDEVLRRLRDDDATRDIPVIILSADATPHQVERLLAAGATRYLIKPLDVKAFLQILDETLTQGER